MSWCEAGRERLNGLASRPSARGEEAAARAVGFLAAPILAILRDQRLLERDVLACPEIIAGGGYAHTLLSDHKAIVGAAAKAAIYG